MCVVDNTINNIFGRRYRLFQYIEYNKAIYACTHTPPLFPPQNTLIVCILYTTFLFYLSTNS